MIKKSGTTTLFDSGVRPYESNSPWNGARRNPTDCLGSLVWPNSLNDLIQRLSPHHAGLMEPPPRGRLDRDGLPLAGFWGWDRSKLLHQTQVVGTDPGFDDLSVCQTKDSNTGK